MTFEHIELARDALRKERQRMSVESDAFKEFLARLESFNARPPSTQPSTTQSSPAIQAVTAQPVSGTETTAVRKAYEGTVMAVSHYDEDYGDEYHESIAEEFGEQLAIALERESTLTPLLKSQLQQAAQKAATEREQFLNPLDAEKEILSKTENKIEAIQEELTVIRSRPFFECPNEELKILDEDLSHLEEQCETLISARQSELRQQRRTLHLPTEFPHLALYLYQDLEVTYPVLATVATLSRNLKQVQEQIKTSLAISQG